MNSSEYLILPLLQGFYWFDEGLQSYLKSKGWSAVTRPQSMIMSNVILGVNKPSDIARRLGISRQAIHTTLDQMVEQGLLELRDDPSDKRSKVVVISKSGERRRQDARRAMMMLTEELSKRIGSKNVENLQKAFAAEWGPPVLTAEKPRKNTSPPAVRPR